MQYAFLSDDWVTAARKLREEAGSTAASPTVPVKMNLVVTDVPFGDGTVDAHMDTTDGALDVDLGHLDKPDATATLDYATARSIIVDADPQAGMQAFMAGKIKLQGDLAKAMQMPSEPRDPELTRKLREITS